MTRSARDFLVYACTSCGKRVFTDPSNVGRRGKCPVCGAKHVIGGPKLAEPGQERRRAARVKLPDSQVALQRKHGAGEDELAGGLFGLEDLSETGVSFRLPGVKDSRKLSGVSAPLMEGNTLQVTLHLGERPRVFAAEVRRVVPPEKPGGLFLIGARFTSLNDLQRADLARVVRQAQGGGAS